MKKTILTFGIISGAISSVLMFATLPFLHKIGYDKGLIVGYTGMVVAFLLVFFGIRSYRENYGGGKITFFRAFAVGILITLISCLFYVATWQVIYFKIMPDFIERIQNYEVEKAKSSGATQDQIAAINKEMKEMKAMEDNPLVNAAATFVEPFPVGLLITLISAAVLRKKRDDGQKLAEQVNSGNTQRLGV